ncbi:MAG: DUF285 domain-containing protein [Cytophagia bacterium]|nr:DUF285 domain-containing protein [Cytophagia bacterium]
MKIKLLLLISIVFLFSCTTEEILPTYTIETNVTPLDGGELKISPQKSEYREGEIITVIPEPSEGWIFKEWKGDFQGNTNPLQIIMNSNKSIIGVFEEKSYNLNLTIIGEGTVEEKIISNPSGKVYPNGTLVELIPKPSEGWVFGNWGGDLNGSQSPITILVDGEKNVKVYFIPNPNFYLGPNEITCMCPNSRVGEKGSINGVIYESVDNNLIRKRFSDGEDMTKLCTSLVTDLSELFMNSTFNQPIGHWDVSNVTKFNRLFFRSKFNQPIGDWDVSNGIDMSQMFEETPFNQPIGNWNVGKVKNMGNMFLLSKFNQPIGNWDVSQVFTMVGMFMSTEFNQPIGNWDVSNVQFMSNMFLGTPFDHPIGDWDVSNVTKMSQMFYSSDFNHPIGNWDVGNVEEMFQMFRLSKFNQPIGDWNVRNVTKMVSMFGDSNFNQDISKWCVPNILSEPVGFSSNSPLSPENKPKWGTCPD